MHTWSDSPWGGWTALGFALEHPERVRSLMLAGITSATIRQGLEELSGRLDGEPAQEQLGRHPALDDSLAARDPARACLYQTIGGFGDPDLSRIAPRLFAATRSRETLAELRVPALFIVGDRDPFFPPRLVREVSTQLPDARVAELPGCGHSPYFEAPDSWNGVLGQFLTACEA